MPTGFPQLGWLEGVINTPSNHRVHHARNPEYLDANFGGVLVVFDRLFGNYIQSTTTCRATTAPSRHGSPRAIRYVINFSPWIGLIKDLAIGALAARGLDVHLRPAGLAAGWRELSTAEIRRRAGLVSSKSNQPSQPVMT